MVCKKCGAEIKPGAAFCTGCGSSVKEMFAAPVEAPAFCSACGAKLAPGQLFCTNCGKRVAVAPVAPAVPVVPAAPAPVEPVAPVAAEPAVAAPTAPGSAGGVKLYDVEPKTAAMIMAIVADRMGKPLNELRFISIKEVK
jgi:hypothetical protein